MQLSEQSKKIGNKFDQYVRTGDRSLIDQFKRKDIETAVVQYSRDKDMPFYQAMVMRISEMKESEDNTRSNKEKWKDRVITFILGLLSGLLLYWLTS